MKQPSDMTAINSTQPREKSNHLFPVFLKLTNLRLLIVGGGYAGMEKLLAVLSNSPETAIKLVATVVSDEIKQLGYELDNLELAERPYHRNDLQHIDILIVAINDKKRSAQIYNDAKAAGILVNVADTPELCDFYLSSVVKKGNLKIAISTNGKSPTVAKRVKEMLNAAIPEQIDELLNNMQRIRTGMSGSFEEKVAKLNKITRTLSENEDAMPVNSWKRIARWSLIVFGIMLTGHFIFSYIPFGAAAAGIAELYGQLQPNFPWIVLAGFLAQLIDGSLGMGYGISSATVLLSAGVNPAAISSSIHTAEIFASGASGYSHYRFGNVNKKLFKALVIPGVIGAFAGAILLVKLGESHAQYLRPVMAVYTLVLGIKFIINAFKQRVPQQKFRHYKLLAGAGGFLDSFGGGGWGPIVTSTLIHRGRNPKYVIGTVSLTEFFVTLSSAFSFFILIGVTHWQVILALITGSMAAAPIAAKLAGKMPKKTAFLLLGILVIVWSIRILVKIY